MASSTVPTLKLDGRNWKVYWASLLEAAATKGWLGILSGQETNDESLWWEGKDAQLKMLFYQTVPIPLILKIQNFRTSHEMFDYLVTTFRDPTLVSIPTKKPIKALSDNEMQELCAKPNKLSVEPPSEERLEDGLTEARSEGKAEATVGEAQQTSSRSVKVEDCLPEVPSELRVAQNELQEQPSSRAGVPLESKHIKVLYNIVEELGKVKNVNRKAKEDLPTKPCDGSPANDLPSVQELLLEGEQALCMSTSITNSQSGYTEEPQLTIYNPGGTLEWPTASFQKAEMDEGGCRVPLEGELADCASDHAGSASNGSSGQEEPIDPQVESTGHNGKDNMTSSDNVNLERVEAALLARESQDAY
ncbi:hypothetical protein EDD16DRAFT_1527130 [Pisolithus croceorrhizus]|nr:hypothetical protein EDD16DRAFT_1527130 [Pisolithus croceorrhizus]